MRYAIDYRNMHTAIHGLLVFNTKADAQLILRSLEQSQDPDEKESEILLDIVFGCADQTIEEIDYRHIVNGKYMHGADQFIVINSPAIDLYGV